MNNGGNIAGFGQKSLRLSNLYATGDFDIQTYSAPVSDPAGEDLPNTVYIAKFSFFDPTYQKDLLVTVSPDNGIGGRMSWVSLTDTPAGVLVTESDSPEVDGNFVYQDLATLSHGNPHTIEFRIKLNRGPDNDQVRISIDGVDTGQCFTTWENAYRADPADNGTLPTGIDRLELRTSVPAPDLLPRVLASCSTMSPSLPVPGLLHPDAT